MAARLLCTCSLFHLLIYSLAFKISQIILMLTAHMRIPERRGSEHHREISYFSMIFRVVPILTSGMGFAST